MALNLAALDATATCHPQPRNWNRSQPYNDHAAEGCDTKTVDRENALKTRHFPVCSVNIIPSKLASFVSFRSTV